MEFCGVCREFDLTNQQQYDTIGQFWDEMAMCYGLENLQGLGFHWQKNSMSYAIGLKNGVIPGADLRITLPDSHWMRAEGKTEHLKELYDAIYANGRLLYEIETFYEDGSCEIQYYR